MLDGYSIINFQNSIPANAGERSCNGCTACCEGWLTCNIYGYEVKRNQPCRFLSKNSGCSAYNMRPYDPCKTFKCYWKQDDTIPENFKPSVSGVIMIYRTSAEGIKHLDLVEGKKSLSLEILDFALTRYRQKKVDNVRWFIGDKVNYVSNDQRFINKMKDLYKD